jgi:hypothetical protein
MAASMRSELAAGILTQEQLSDTLSDYILRDEHGSYWALAPRSQQWYRHGLEGWIAAVSTPTRFEGLSSLGVWEPRSETEAVKAKTEIEGKTASNVHEFMKNIIEDVHRSYVRGLITSVTAHALISDVFLMDKGNRFWTLGFHSKNWYFFEAEQWHKSDAPPALDTLMDTHAQEPSGDLDQAIINFLVAMAGNPPEPITDKWDPPDHFPEPVFQCPSCSRTDVGLHTQCKFCNSEIPESTKVLGKITRF